MLCAVTVTGGSGLSGLVFFVWVALGGGSGLSVWPCMLCVGVLVWWEWSSLFVIVCSVWVAVGEDCVFGTPLPPPLAAWLAVCRPCPVLGPREQYRPIAVQGEWRGSAGLGPTPLFSGDDGHSFGPFLILVSKLHCPKVPKLHCPKVPLIQL